MCTTQKSRFLAKIRFADPSYPLIVANNAYHMNFVVSSLLDKDPVANAYEKTPYYVRGFDDIEKQANVILNTLRFFGIEKVFVVHGFYQKFSYTALERVEKLNRMSKDADGWSVEMERDRDVERLGVGQLGRGRLGEQIEDNVVLLNKAKRFGARFIVSFADLHLEMCFICHMHLYKFNGFGHVMSQDCVNVPESEVRACS